MRLGLIGFGNIAQSLLTQMAQSFDKPLEHLAVLSRAGSAEAARATLAAEHGGVARAAEVVTDCAALLASAPDLVVECAGHGGVVDHVPHILRAGTDVVVVSIGALADDALHATLTEAARAGKARVILAPGAIGGVDLLSALGGAGEVQVRYRGIKPPRAWAGTPAAELLDLDGMTDSAGFFQGTARQAALDYPKNANVAATLALAGAGFDATDVELVADPDAPGNIHEYSVQSPFAAYSIRIENKASKGNAKTSQSTVFSVLREVRNRIGPIAI